MVHLVNVGPRFSHDGGHERLGVDRSVTVQATDELIRRYSGEGSEFVTVTQMLDGVSAASRSAS